MRAANHVTGRATVHNKPHFELPCRGTVVTKVPRKDLAPYFIIQQMEGTEMGQVHTFVKKQSSSHTTIGYKQSSPQVRKFGAILRHEERRVSPSDTLE